MRTSVDLPEPDRPMTTNTSPGQTSIEMSRTATTLPVFSRSSARDRSASGVPITLSAFLPEHLPDALGTEQRVAGAIRGRWGFSGLHGARAVRVAHVADDISGPGGPRQP